MQIWKNQGILFHPDDGPDWMVSHAQVPCIDIKGSSAYIYFSSRNKNNKCLPGRIKINLKNFKIEEISEEPLFGLGKPGMFDDSGIMPSCIFNKFNKKKYMFYVGWNVPTTVPFRNCIGAAISEDGGKTFRKLQDGPVLDRNKYSPLFLATSFVMQIPPGRFESMMYKFRMWYLSGNEFRKEGEKWRSFYNIRHANIHFNGDNNDLWVVPQEEICCDYDESKKECAIARPWIRLENGKFKMWYSYRWDNYNIGYAESDDGIKFNRIDDIKIDRQEWDSDMQAYPCVFEYRGNKYMLYNGNGFGKTGIGLAKYVHNE